ncbi:transport permease protein [Sphaerisporangium rufum]|uniref:Transport permease protein n=1 Tax=Sphaerisporangium rufum TaxID=1381558 RepID=A0A919RB88_9ACTN|nr:ABC transporter permease [Sphaerisporangium rufum]GII81550.1 transport permease protein [Sphaerisporangium rufum]
MRGLGNVIAIELRLAMRDPMAAFFALAFPVVILWVKMRNGGTLPGGLPIIDAFVPMLSVFVLGLASLVVLPATLAQYRERRVLKRLRATPASAGMILGAQWAAHMLLAVLGTALLTVVGLVAYGLGGPADLTAVVLAWVLGALSLGAIGLLVGALVPTGRTATVVGLALFFPMVFVSGALSAWETLPASMRSIGGLTPMAPAVRAVRAGWEGQPVSPLTFAAMAAIFLVAGGLGLRAFRW